MQDMLVNLLQVKPYQPELDRLKERGIEIFRPIGPDRKRVVDWVGRHSSLNAASEMEVCFANRPVSCFIAVKGHEIIGYACYHATAPDFFGPTRVLDQYQGQGIGQALLLRTLAALREEGYAYAIIGGVGPVEFYQRAVNAVLIKDSDKHSIYHNFIGLREKEKQNKK